MQLTLQQKSGELLSDTLFKSDKISGVKIFMREHTFIKGQFSWSGYIDFKNGSYSGEKSFKVEGIGGLEELLKQMDEFIKQL